MIYDLYNESKEHIDEKTEEAKEEQKEKAEEKKEEEKEEAVREAKELAPSHPVILLPPHPKKELFPDIR